MLFLLYTSDLFTMILYILHPIKLNITVKPENEKSKIEIIEEPENIFG